MNLYLFDLSKTGTKTAPRVPKLGYYEGRVPLPGNVGGRRGLSYTQNLSNVEKSAAELVQIFFRPFLN